MSVHTFVRDRGGSVSVTAASKGAGFAFFGGSTAVLGQMANLSANEWGVLLTAIFLSLLSGSMASMAIIEHHNGHDREKIVRERKLRVMIFAAQFVFGVIIASQVGGNIWFTMPACLAVGWTGTQFLDWLAKRMGFGGVE